MVLEIIYLIYNVFGLLGFHVKFLENLGVGIEMNSRIQKFRVQEIRNSGIQVLGFWDRDRG